MIWLLVIALICAIMVMALARKGKGNECDEEPKEKYFVDSNGRLRDSHGRFAKSK